jgi:hypothetical protein
MPRQKQALIAPKQLVTDFRQLRMGKLTQDDITGLAQLEAYGHTTKEAAVLMGIKPQTVYDWFNRNENQSKYSELVTRAKGIKLNGLLSHMESVGCKDWRMYNERLCHIAPERFSTKQNQQSSTNLSVTVDFGPALKIALANMQAKQAKVIDVTPQPVVSCGVQPKQIEDNNHKSS